MKGHSGQGHDISRAGVKLINGRELKVMSRSAAFYANYSRKILGWLHHPPRAGEGSTILLGLAMLSILDLGHKILSRAEI